MRGLNCIQQEDIYINSANVNYSENRLNEAETSYNFGLNVSLKQFDSSDKLQNCYESLAKIQSKKENFVESNYSMCRLLHILPSLTQSWYYWSVVKANFILCNKVKYMSDLLSEYLIESNSCLRMFRFFMRIKSIHINNETLQDYFRLIEVIFELILYTVLRFILDSYNYF